MVAATAAFAPTAGAQRFVPLATAGRAGHAGFARFGRGVHRGSSNWLVGPYFYSDYDSGYDQGPEIIEAPAPQVIAIPVAQAAAPARVAGPAESLVLELHGDHWVRVTNHGETMIDAAFADAPATAGASPVGAVHVSAARQVPERAAEPKLPPAVLVFRDGHKEEIEKYTIVGATIYTGADYWRTGSWSRSVSVADLDVPATLKLNQEAGANFRLPSGPSEVVIRP